MPRGSVARDPHAASVVMVLCVLAVGLGFATQVVDSGSAALAGGVHYVERPGSPSGPGGAGTGSPGNRSSGGTGVPGGGSASGNGSSSGGSGSTGTGGSGSSSGTGTTGNGSTGTNAGNSSSGTIGIGNGSSSGNLSGGVGNSSSSGNSSGNASGVPGGSTGGSQPGSGTSRSPTPPRAVVQIPPLSAPLVVFLGLAMALASAILAGALVERRRRPGLDGAGIGSDGETSTPPAGDSRRRVRVTGLAPDSVNSADAADPRARIVREYGRFLRAVEPQCPVAVRSLTPKEVAAEVRGVWGPRYAEVLDETRGLFEEARYSPHPISGDQADRFGRAVLQLVAAAPMGGRRR